MELLAPAGTPDSLRAAVAGGADAVYFGAGAFNARIHAGNFTDEEVAASVEYCHRRGVKCHAVLNTLVSDRELPEALCVAEKFVKAGIDAFIVQDVGLARALALRTGVPLHASTQMTLHSLEGVLQAIDMGFTRIVLSRELSLTDMEYIRRRAPEGTELEVFVHGALCMCYSGQCYMSSVIGERSGNRGLCAQPCRLPYEGGYRLSLKDMCLLDHLRELEEIGIDSLKIEGRMKSPEYVYTVTRHYADALRGKPVTPADVADMEEVFSRGGFTDGYFLGKPGREMFGTKTPTEGRALRKIPTAEYPRIGLHLSLTAADGLLRVSYTGKDGLAAERELPLQPAKNNPLTAENALAALSRTGDTAFYVGSSEAKVEGEWFLPNSALNSARRECLGSLEDILALRVSRFEKLPLPSPQRTSAGKPTLRGYFLSASSIPANAGRLEKILLPLSLLGTKAGENAALMYGEKTVAVLPQIFHDTEREGILSLIGKAYTELGVREFEADNLGQLRLLADLKMTKYPELVLHGGFGLNVYNSYTLDFFRNMGLASQILTFEAPLARLRSMAGEDCGILAYGRLPFMVMRNCTKKNHHRPEILRDRKGKEFLLTCEYGCRNRLFNADPLWLADKNTDGFGFLGLLFTDESRERAAEVISAYLGGDTTPPKSFTRGLYFK